MAKKQTRGSVSMNRELLEKARKFVAAKRKTLAHWVSDTLRAELERNGVRFESEFSHMTPADVAKGKRTKSKTTKKRNDSIRAVYANDEPMDETT